jgi:hypothetical protein
MQKYEPILLVEHFSIIIYIPCMYLDLFKSRIVPVTIMKLSGFFTRTTLVFERVDDESVGTTDISMLRCSRRIKTPLD